MVQQGAPQLVLRDAPAIEHRHAREYANAEGAHGHRHQPRPDAGGHVGLAGQRQVDGVLEPGVEPVLAVLIAREQHQTDDVSGGLTLEVSPQRGGDLGRG